MNKVYVVQALSRRTCEFELLGIFDTQKRAEDFKAQAPMPQREQLRIGEWTVNEYPTDAFWLDGYDPERYLKGEDSSN